MLSTRRSKRHIVKAYMQKAEATANQKSHDTIFTTEKGRKEQLVQYSLSTSGLLLQGLLQSCTAAGRRAGSQGLPLNDWH